MPFDSQITRDLSAALSSEAAAREIIQNVPEQSAVMRLARRLPNMTKQQLRLPVLSALATAYFVDGDAGTKQTTQIEWDNKFINAAELAVIVPIPEVVVADSDYDMWAEVRPRIAEAIGVAFDAAVLHGVNAPGDWPDDLTTGATAAGNAVALGTGTDVFDDIMGEDGTIAQVEEDGYLVDGHAAAMVMRSRLRGLRDSTGQPIFLRTMQETTRYELDGAPVEFPRNGAIDPAEALMFSGDWSQLVYSIRQDLTFKVFTEGVINDATGNIIHNLMQNDMIALRAVIRLGWQLPNPINRVNDNAATRYPFAVLTPPVGP